MYLTGTRCLIYCPTNERLVTDLSPLWKPLCFFFLFLHYGLLALCSSFRFFPAGCSPCKLDEVEQSISLAVVVSLRFVPKQRPSTSVTSSLERVANRSEQSSFSNKLPSAFTNLIHLSYKTEVVGRENENKACCSRKGDTARDFKSSLSARKKISSTLSRDKSCISRSPATTSKSAI